MGIRRGTLPLQICLLVFQRRLLGLQRPLGPRCLGRAEGGACQMLLSRAGAAREARRVPLEDREDRRVLR